MVGLLPDDVALHAAQLPGRWDLLARTPFTDMACAVEVLADSVQSSGHREFAFFGHSMGAVLAYEVALELRRRGAEEPDLLIATGAAAPHLRRDEGIRESLGCVDGLVRLGGIDERLLTSEHLLEIVLSPLRADLTMLEGYRYRRQPSLRCPVAVFGGYDDDLVSESDLAGWGDLHDGGVTVECLPGGHFFLWDELPAIVGTALKAWPPQPI